MNQKGDFLRKILRITKEASERKMNEMERKLSYNIEAGYKKMLEAIEKQAKNGCYWASIRIKHEYSGEIAAGVLNRLKEEGFDGNIKNDHLRSTIVEAYWSMLGDKDEKKG